MAPPQGPEVVDVDFSGGQETWLDERLVAPGKWLSLTNCTLSQTGLPVRRSGYSAVGTGGKNGVAELNGEFLSLGATTLSSLNTFLGSFVAKGTMANAAVSKRELVRTTGSQFFPDSAASTNTICVVWRDVQSDGLTINGISGVVLDSRTYAILAGPFAIATSSTVTCPRVTNTDVADIYMVFWCDKSGTKLQARTVSNTGVVSAITTLETNATDILTGGMDATYMNAADTTIIMVVYASTNATNSTFALAAKVLAGVPTVLYGPTAITTQTNMPDEQITSVAAVRISSTRYVAVVWGSKDASHSDLWTAVLDNTMSITTSATKQDSFNLGTTTGTGGVVGSLNGPGTASIYYDFAGNIGSGNSLFPIRTLTISGAGAVTGPSNFAPSSTDSDNGFLVGPFIWGKPINVTGGPYLPVYFSGSATNGGIQNSWFLLDPNGVAVGKALYGTAGSNYRAGFFLVGGTQPCSTISLGGAPAQYGMVMAERNTLNFTNGLNVSQTGLCLLTITPNTPGQSLPPAKGKLAGSLFLAGGALSAYDGAQATEAGFHLFPEAIGVVDGAAGVVDAGSHQYVALYEWIDGQGRRLQSSPSPVFTYIAPGSKEATVSVPSLLLTQKQNVNLVVYRTKVNGLTFYRLPATSINAPVANNPAASFTTVTDGAADGSIGGNEILYTQGGAVLANDGPPPCSTCVTHQGRLWIDVGDDLNAYRFSQQEVANVGLQWNETLGGHLPADSGGVVAFASMDDKLIIFGKRKVYVIYGQGPTPDGLNSGYSSPIEIPSDVGCSDPRSVLVLPAGVMFQSTKGWHLLTRGLAVEYKGSGVENTLGNVVYSAVLHQGRREARFGLAGVNRGLFGAVIYDYVRDQWSIFTNYSVQDAIWSEYKGAYVWCDGASIQADTGNTDNGSVITTTALSAWWKLRIMGFQSISYVYVVGPYSSASNLTLSYGVDYDAALTAISTLSTSSLTTPSSNAFMARWNLPVQKCTAIRFQLQDIPTGGSNGGVGFSGMSLEVEPLEGGARLPEGQSS